MTDLDLQEIHDFLIRVAESAGAMITSAKPSTTTTGEKMNSADLVTETDRAVEQMVSSKLKEKYPSFSFMGEETYKPGDKLTPNPTFVVDPIDGTTNFVHGFPYACISLGLAVDLAPVVGVVYNPFNRTLYSAVRGGGAHLNRTTPLPLRTPPPRMTGLDAALVCVEWGAERAGNDFDVKSQTFARLCAPRAAGGAMLHGLRSLGSAALNLCAVAAGHLDLYWEAGCWPWDVCAGWAILAEAGGLVVDANPGNWSPRLDQRRYLAVRKGDGQTAMVEQFWSFVQGRFEVGPSP